MWDLTRVSLARRARRRWTARRAACDDASRRVAMSPSAFPSLADASAYAPTTFAWTREATRANGGITTDRWLDVFAKSTVEFVNRARDRGVHRSDVRDVCGVRGERGGWVARACVR